MASARERWQRRRRRWLLLTALLAWAANVTCTETAAAQGPEAPATPTPSRRDGPVELAVFGGIGTLVGPAGVSAAFLPLPRLALGLALGRVGLEAELGDAGNGALRVAPFVRGYVVDRPAWRFGLGVTATHGEEITHHAGTADDGTPAVIFWHRSNATRLDGSVLIELVRGNVALRLEAALGRMYGGASCVGRFSTGSVGPCQAAVLGQPGPEVTESPSPWRHSLQLALAVRPGVTVPDSASQAALPTDAGRWRVSLAATHARRTDFIEEQTYADGTRFEAGIEAEYIRPAAAGRGIRWGAGARYSYGAGPPASSTDFGKSEHVAFVPALLGWAWRSLASGEEIEVLGGIGPGLTAISRFSDHASWAAAGGVELALNYLRPLPLEGRWALVVGVGARVLVLWPWSDPSVYGYHAEIPIHVGLRF